MEISRAWAMPNAATFSIKPVHSFIKQYVTEFDTVVDPFARDSQLATHTNDLNPETLAVYHMKAEDFMGKMAEQKSWVDVVLIDPPYSPRQISECYKASGLTASMRDTQNARMMKEIRDATDKMLCKNGTVLSFGWNTNGMGKGRGFEILEILLVAHGGSHNDTICMAERRCD